MQPQEADILNTWHQNARPWIHAIANNEIQSRHLVTNSAVIAAITALNPKSIWDVGCGEGWLCRALQPYGIEIFGTDAIPELITTASEKGGKFKVASYQQIIEKTFTPTKKFEAIVFNFSLFGNEMTDILLKEIIQYILPGGHLIIQTLHPLTACGNELYMSGWRAGSWNGFDAAFCNPAPWYFRTLEGWVLLILNCGYQLKAIQEPIHPATKKPASLILIASF